MTSSSPPAMIAQLATLLSLDQETITTQILPYMTTSLRSPAEVQGYLTSLLPPTLQGREFTTKYMALRFPPPPPPPVAQGGKAGWGARVPSSSSSSKQPPPPTTDHSTLSREFGQGGTVYVKNRVEEEGGWGGGGKGKARGSGSNTPTSGAGSRVNSRSSTPLPPPAIPATPAPAPTPAPSKSQSKQAEPTSAGGAGVVDLSEAASVELLAVDRALRSLGAGGGGPAKRGGKGCFCQAREHPLSPYIPLCPSCALPLCQLNAPTAPCPSCSHSPLLPSPLLASHIASLTTQRESILAREKRRIEREWEEAERERRAVRFPGLGDAGARGKGEGVGSRRGYADLVGGGQGGVEERIERGFQTRLGEQGGKMKKGGAGGGGEERAPTVLRLNMKTNKVKIQAVTRRKVVKPDAQSIVTVQEVLPDQEEEEDDDSDGTFLDPTDDGLLSRFPSLHPSPPSPTPGHRPFHNVTLPPSARPTWTEPPALESIDLAELGGAEVDAPQVARAVVPGAAVIKEDATGAGGGKKKARSRGAGKKKEGATLGAQPATAQGA